MFAVLHKPNRAINPVTVVATVDEDGSPRTAPFGSVRAVTPRLLRLISARYHDTYANLARDGRVMVALLAPPDIAVSIRGRARVARERMNTSEGSAIVDTDYYTSRQADIVAVFEIHAQAWHPFLTSRYGPGFAESIRRDARARHQTLIPQLPYIGGDENPMTRHLINSTTSLALYQAMRARGKAAQEAGKIIYDAVVESVSYLPLNPPPDLSPEYIVRKREEARASRDRRYPGDWVWEFIEGDSVTFRYGYDFFECGTQKLYHAHGADEFLPFYCFLDFVTYRTPGWSFTRTMTLSEGHTKCDFRFREGGHTRKDWPPSQVQRT